MHLDEFANIYNHVLVYHDERYPGKGRVNSGLLYDTKTGKYYLSSYITDGTQEATEDVILQNTHLVNDSSDFLRLLEQYDNPSISEVIHAFASFCEGEKSIGHAFNKLKDPILNMYHFLPKYVKILEQTTHERIIYKSLKYKIIKSTDKYHLSVHSLPITKVIIPALKATSEYPDLHVKIDGNNVVLKFTSLNLLYHLDLLRRQYNESRKLKNRLKKLFKIGSMNQ